MLWAARTVYLIGGGPSLSGFEFERIRGRGVVVAINDAALHVPWADAVLSIDTVWMRNRAANLRAFPGERILIAPEDRADTPDIPGATYLVRKRGAGISADHGIVLTGDNSGFAALGLALMRKAGRVGLLGYDMRSPGHWHAGYAWRSRHGARDYPAWVQNFRVLDRVARHRGIRVVNCNPRSAIRCFEFGKPEEIAE